MASMHMMYSKNWKAKKGLIRVTLDLDGNRIKDIHISGDFFMFPEDSINRLEDMLRGSSIEKINDIIRDFYNQGVITPGVEPEDFIQALRVI
uniref:Putative lipoate-protein ligase A subunit 2 n=1 Tax=Thermoplasma acidophilum (strain ATCC 25905 / DSM 1728 / JCM 9062 / NBRC 15155 / AMRC-C165) TaxID=273075 RepID=UPI00025C07A0|nr:Chain C, Putative lipoate-protein ligase A subunit 2 [Thermoplasma acidophilum DSM 1728]